MGFIKKRYGIKLGEITKVMRYNNVNGFKIAIDSANWICSIYPFHSDVAKSPHIRFMIYFMRMSCMLSSRSFEKNEIAVASFKINKALMP